MSLGDSAGLSSPGGFAITEKYAFTREAMAVYMRALREGGILSVTLWNKEDPPKSILKLYATMAAAAGDVGGAPSHSFYVASTYLSTTTVLYKRGGFSADEIAKLSDFTRSLSFDEVYYPGMNFDGSIADKLLADYDAQIFGEKNAGGAQGDATGTADDSDVLAPLPDTGTGEAQPQVLPAISMARLVC